MKLLDRGSEEVAAEAGVPEVVVPKVFVKRIELRLARHPAEPLKELPLDPDALAVFARQFAAVNADPRFAESAEVCVDLLPVTGPRGRRLRRRIAKHTGRPELGLGRAAGEGAGRAGGFMQQVLDEAGMPGSGWGGGVKGGRGSERPTPGRVVEHRVETTQLAAKVAAADQMFEVQVLLRVWSLDEARADMLIKGLLAAFRIFKGHNEWRPAGLNVLGATFIGSDVPGLRWWFDRRADTGLWSPRQVRGGNVLNTLETATFWRPPTKACDASNVVRGGPYLSPAPMDLPVYRRRAGELPIGKVWRGGREVMVAKQLYTWDVDENGKRKRKDEFFFGGVFGRARQGKTELVLNWLVHVALCEAQSGAFFLDPHIDGVQRVMPYMTGPGVRSRLIVMDLSKRGLNSRHVGWNPMSMTGLDAERVGWKTRALADAFAVAAGWSPRATPRTVAILDNAINSLLHIGLQLGPRLQPTIFTIPRLLTDDVFRRVVTLRLPNHLRLFWDKTYANYGPDAAGPISQLISRLQTIPTVRATLGAEESTYDPRRAMDTGRIVLASPSSVTDHLVSALMLSAHIDAARSRTDIEDPEARRLFFMFFDEAQTFDFETTQGSMLAAFLEQTGKFGVRAVPMAQSPHRMKESTLEALATNASTIATTATAPRAAEFFQKQWGADSDVDAKRAVMRLPRYRYVMQVTHKGMRVDPFRVEGVPLEEAWADHRHPESLGVLDMEVDLRYRKATVRETLDRIEHHDDRIMHALINGQKGSGNGGPPSGGGGGPSGGGPPPRPTKPGPTPADDAELDGLDGDGWDIPNDAPPKRPGS